MSVRALRDLDLTQLSPAELMKVFDELALDNDGLDLWVGVANSAEGPWELALEAMLKPRFADRARR